MTTLNNARSIIAEIIDTSELEVTGNICACALRRTQRQPAAPAALIRQDICDQFDLAEQSLWQDMPEAMRVKISREIPASAPTEFPRKACQHDTTSDGQSLMINTSDCLTAQSSASVPKTPSLIGEPTVLSGALIVSSSANQPTDAQHKSPALTITKFATFPLPPLVHVHAQTRAR